MSDAGQDVRRLPTWLRRPLGSGSGYAHTEAVLESLGMETICVNAHCPNRGECWSRGTATVLILGKVCTRRCGFCSVAGGRTALPDTTEPTRVAEMARQLRLKYLVITSVTRDDLADGGAGQFRDCIQAVKGLCPETQVEILTPDFRGCQREAVEMLCEEPPFVFGHNVETVRALYATVRPGGDYRRSLRLLEAVKEYDSDIVTKSSIMLGLGETEAEVLDVLEDLRAAGCDRVTIGQYLKSSPDALEVVEYIAPEKFAWWKETAAGMDFSWVCSSPFARSSYRAEQETV